MAALEGILGFLLVGWLAVFTLACINKFRGTPIKFFGPGDKPHLPAPQSRPWWQHLIRVPVYIIILLGFALMIAVILPPFYVVELPGRIRQRLVPKA